MQRPEYANGTYLTHLDDSNEDLSDYGYDAFGRIKTHRWKASGGSLIAGWSHDHDRLGNKEYSEDLVLTTTDDELYGYDDVHRLTGFERGALNANKDDITSPDRSQAWALEPLGNWDSTVNDATTETRTHNSVNELTARTVGQDPQISLTYDDAGNLTQDGSADGHHQYVWDYGNRLIEVKEYQTDTWNTTAEYKSDARSRRILKVVTNKGDLNGTTRFLWGGDSDWQCLEERDSSGDLVARYTYAPGYIDDVAVQERDLNDDQDFGDADEVVYYHQNTLFSVYALTDASETVTERYRYDAYGGCGVLDADGSADADGISDVGNAYAFTGRRVDLESGLMQYRHRYYSTACGRFVSRDPREPSDGNSLYSYVSSKPVSLSDAFGLWQKPPRDRDGWEQCNARAKERFLDCLDLCEFFMDTCRHTVEGTAACCHKKCAKKHPKKKGHWHRWCMMRCDIYEHSAIFGCWNLYWAMKLDCSAAYVWRLDQCDQKYYF